ncbi:uncharacterized protein LOC118207948 [Anguilla anguilla]|uniref:uncharacterized protein LOC118207948 n=1 Tax=Anguilla anguilla TaxID=7936 RepID=UPI0015AE3A08|nr:uncharacterized protein LOC118207948 [Anguilla anguilla]
MDFGVLEAAVTLGLMKIVCSLLCFPALRGPFNPVGFCCSCLLIFTDLLVTAFLTFLWLAKPWQPHSWASSDVIVPRLLLFLDHTYGAAMLLTAPLIAVDTACRLWWPLESEKWGEGGVHAGDPVPLNSECPQDRSTGASCDSETGAEGAGHGQSGSLMHLPGFLCSLLVWSFCGCSGERDWSAEGRLVGACLQAGGSLSSCLPDLLTVALQTLGSPSRPLATFALSLVLALTMGVLRGGWGQGGPRAQTDKRKEDTDTPDAGPVGLAVPASVRHGVKTHAAHTAYTSSGVAVHSRAEDGHTLPTSPTMLTSAGHCLPPHSDGRQGPCGKSEAAALSCRGAPHGYVLLAIPEMGTRLSSAPRCSACSAASPHGQPHPCGGGRRGGRDQGSVLFGLVCTALLCLFPPTMAINGMLIRSVERLAEWSLRRVLPASR